MKRIKTLLCFLTVAVLAAATISFLPAAATESATPAATRGFSYGKEMSGKSVVFYGDSITARYIDEHNYEDDFRPHYTQLLAKEFGFYFANYAISGATFAETDKNALVEIENSSAILASADYVSIMLGTNDYGFGRSLGTPSSAASESTVYGSIKLTLNTIFKANPNVKVMLVTPVDRFDYGKGMDKANPKGYTLSDVVTAIKTVGDQYGVTVADVSGIITKDNKYEMLQRDSLHLSSDGYAALAAALKEA